MNQINQTQPQAVSNSTQRSIHCPNDANELGLVQSQSGKKSSNLDVLPPIFNEMDSISQIQLGKENIKANDNCQETQAANENIIQCLKLGESQMDTQRNVCAQMTKAQQLHSNDSQCENGKVCPDNEQIQNILPHYENNGNSALENNNELDQEMQHVSEIQDQDQEIKSNMVTQNHESQSVVQQGQNIRNVEKHTINSESIQNSDEIKKSTILDLDMKDESAGYEKQKHSNSNNQMIEKQLKDHDFESQGEDSDHLENVMILQHLSGSKATKNQFYEDEEQDRNAPNTLKRNTDSDLSSQYIINKYNGGSNGSDSNDDLEDMNMRMKDVNANNQQQQDIQKLIEEVTKKEEKWTKEQDEKLVKLVSFHKVENIEVVAVKLNNFIDYQKSKAPAPHHNGQYLHKSSVECMDRWLLLRNNTEDGTVKQIKGNWTPEEDMILKNKVAEYGLKKWKEIATFLPGRIGKQCRERWYNNVDPNLNKDKWTIAEDLQLMELHKLYGNKWVQIQKHMPGRIDNDIKNRFNASLRKYKTFEQYVEANDRKREKSKKKYYWRQHYELRNVNNSKRLPLNEQDKEFKDMAQQKIQMEVGSNLPPLKNDLIIEKKKELEEYQELKKLKAKFREEKRIQKQREKSNRKRNACCGYKADSNIEISGFEVRTLANQNLRQIADVMNESELKCNDKILSQNSNNVMANPEQYQCREALKEINSIPSVYNTLNSQNVKNINDYPTSLNAQFNGTAVDFESKFPVENGLLLQQPNFTCQEMMTKDELFKEIFKVTKISNEEIKEVWRTQQYVNAFKEFQSNRQYRELFMPTKKQNSEDQGEDGGEHAEHMVRSRKSSCTNDDVQQVCGSVQNVVITQDEQNPHQSKSQLEPYQQNSQTTKTHHEANAQRIREKNQKIFATRQMSNKQQAESLTKCQNNDSEQRSATQRKDSNQSETNQSQSVEVQSGKGAFKLVQNHRNVEAEHDYMERKALEIAKNVDLIAQKADQKALLKSLMTRRQESKEDYSLKYQFPSAKVQQKRYELLKRIQEQLNIIKLIRERRDAQMKPTLNVEEPAYKPPMLQKRQRDQNTEQEKNEAPQKVQKSQNQQAFSYAVSKHYLKLPQVKPISSSQQSQRSSLGKISNIKNSQMTASFAQLFKPFRRSDTKPLFKPAIKRDEPACIIKHPLADKAPQSHQQIFQNLAKFTNAKVQSAAGPNLLVKASSGIQPSCPPPLTKQASGASEKLQLLMQYMQNLQKNNKPSSRSMTNKSIDRSKPVVEPIQNSIKPKFSKP